MSKPFVPFDKFEKSCAPLGKPLAASMQESCKDRLVPDEPAPCSSKPCPPYWQRTCEMRCLDSGLVEYEEADGCGNIRWVRTTEQVVWTDDELTSCVDPNDASERIYMRQTNQCGDERFIDTGDVCCYPAWVGTGNFNCELAMLRESQEDGCGNERLHTSSTPVAWVANGSTRCSGDNYEQQEENQCGDTRWTVVSPYTWSDTGNTRCVGALIEIEQENQCGTLRWIASDVPLTWTDTGTVTCDGTYVMEQENQCGETRLSDRGAIIWTNTGNTQCGPISENVENEQINQCGDLRWYDTGVSCTVPDPSLPAGFGGQCYVGSSPGSSDFWVRFGNNGTGTVKTVLGGGSSPFSWAPGVVDGAEYEIMVEYAFTGLSASYSGPAYGVWTSLAALVEMRWTISGSTPTGSYLTGTIYIRKVGSVTPETSAEIYDTFISIGVECP